MKEAIEINHKYLDWVIVVIRNIKIEINSPLKNHTNANAAQANPHPKHWHPCGLRFSQRGTVHNTVYGTSRASSVRIKFYLRSTSGVVRRAELSVLPFLSSFGKPS